MLEGSVATDLMTPVLSEVFESGPGWWFLGQFGDWYLGWMGVEG